MKRGLSVLAVVVLLAALAGCAGSEPAATPTPVATPIAETAALHAIPADSVAVTGTATCVFSQEGVDPTRGDNTDLVTCELDMSDPRVSGSETHNRFRYFWPEGEEAGVWVAEEAIITNSEGTWRGTAQAVDDGTPVGEARYVGEGAYDGLVFHYYFGDLGAGHALVHGWISSAE